MSVEYKYKIKKGMNVNELFMLEDKLQHHLTKLFLEAMSLPVEEQTKNVKYSPLVVQRNILVKFIIEREVRKVFV